MNLLESKLQSSPHFANLFSAVAAKNSLQKKRLTKFLSEQPDSYWNFAEDLSKTLTDGLFYNDTEMNQGIDSYNKMCLDFLREQIQFKKCGQYRIASAESARESVYSKVEVMKYYMKGLLLSYMFWPNHFKIFEFFRNGLKEFKFDNYLEVGIGHGLFTAELLKYNKSVEPHVIDISETSIAAAKDLLKLFNIDVGCFDFIHGDFLKVPIKDLSYDFVVMGEVIEHVDNAGAFMDITHKILKKDGVLFLTTCANCPAIDHIYQFNNVKEIRDLITAAGFEILSDVAWPSEDVPEADWQRELVTINYAGFFKKI